MFNLIKKDFITTIKFKSILYVFLITYVISTIGYLLPIPLPIPTSFFNNSIFLGIGIAYFSIMNTFYYDNLNKSNEFILSIPTKREDIVFAKYIFSLVLIMIALCIVSLVYGNSIITLPQLLEFKNITFIMAVLFLSFSIIIPLIYRYGYGKMRIAAPLILFGVYTFTIYIFKPIETKMLIIEKYGSFPITISGASMAQDYSKFYAFIVDSININFVNYTTITIFTVLVFIISMFISTKIFKNKVNA